MNQRSTEKKHFRASSSSKHMQGQNVELSGISTDVQDLPHIISGAGQGEGGTEETEKFKLMNFSSGQVLQQKIEHLLYLVTYLQKSERKETINMKSKWIHITPTRQLLSYLKKIF